MSVDGLVNLNTKKEIPTEAALRIRSSSCSRKKFEVNLYKALFSSEIRAGSNTAGSFKKNKLDPVKMNVIRKTVFALWLSENEDSA